MVLSKKKISVNSYGNGIMTILKLNLFGANEINVLPGFGSERKKLTYRIKHLTGEKIMGKYQTIIIYSVLILFGLFLLPMAGTIGEKKSQTMNDELYAQESQQVKEDETIITTVKVVKNENGFSILPVDPEEVEITTLIHYPNLSFGLPVKYGTVTAGFGDMKHPYTKKVMHHNGIDIATAKETDVYASAQGKVIKTVSEYKKDKGFGKYLIIQHENDFESFYSHLSEILVQEGQKVKAGDIIAKVGTTGMSTGPHLHFEIRKNEKFQNPKDYIDFTKLIKKIKKIEKIK